MAISYKNWSGSVEFNPATILAPTSEAEIQQLVQESQKSGRKIRLIGSGHSFTPLIRTGQTLVSLDKYQGLESVDKENKRATALAGTKLRFLGEKLFEQGLAQENMGDIDVQSIAGAISTGTHGTGANLQTIAAQVHSLNLVTGTGEILHCSETENHDIFKAAQISLGSLGIISKVELNLQPTYKLKYSSDKATLSEALAKLDQHNQNRNFEMYWFPYTETVQFKTTNITEEEPRGNKGFGKWFDEMFMENGLFAVLSTASRYIPGAYKSVSKLSAWGVSKGTKSDYSHKIYATQRFVKFQEMEYNIPAQHFQECLLEVKHTIEKENFRVHFPLELRFAKADDIWLSPAYGRDSAYIAAHMYKGMPHKPYFNALEKIFRKYEGRPHWGKMHTLTAKALAKSYPKWEEFHQIRKQLDPKGIFMNDYLGSIFEG